MSISSALNNAALGLGASARLADTISTNVANAMTPGFGRRTTELSSLTLGGLGSGVRVVGTSRADVRESPLANSVTACPRATSPSVRSWITRSVPP